MKIISIDPGVDTGFVIADASVRAEVVTLKGLEIAVTNKPLEVVRLVVRFDCSHVIMERRPLYASREGTEAYEMIWNGLQRNDYTHRGGLLLGDKGNIVLVYPGLWKPVMRQQGINFGNWSKRIRSHSRDAASMLHYILKVNYQHKEIQYD